MSDEPRRWKGVTLGLNPPAGFGVDVREDRVTDDDVEKIASYFGNGLAQGYEEMAREVLALVLGGDTQ